MMDNVNEYRNIYYKISKIFFRNDAFYSTK